MENIAFTVVLAMKIIAGCVIAIIIAAALFFILASAFYFLATHWGGSIRHKSYMQLYTLNCARERADEEFEAISKLWSRLPPGRWAEYYARLTPEERDEFLPFKTKYITFKEYWKFIARSVILFARKLRS